MNICTKDLCQDLGIRRESVLKASSIVSGEVTKFVELFEGKLAVDTETLAFILRFILFFSNLFFVF